MLIDLVEASSSLKTVLHDQTGARETAFRLGATLQLSALYFLGGVAVFGRLQMRDRL